ncbi:hypothetical protein ACRAWF_19080 [Streptomyces sp. L7]
MPHRTSCTANHARTPCSGASVVLACRLDEGEAADEAVRRRDLLDRGRPGKVRRHTTGVVKSSDERA